ncbi:uncharacterized protein LOC105206106 isoform X2 [Solenopsis invicta]|uniref:uncharacterized protein LOC105206106 isoform X2 n=1 Tax=Solenopsis invicta TaxID=13686 RepID=UPI00193E67D4|nr:uncharacterized protein LOC105206106 isoform X2 [Solenopsis invicta]
MYFHVFYSYFFIFIFIFINYSISVIFDKKMSKKKVSYIQKYRTEWKSDPLLKEWIEELSTDKYMVFCKYCKCSLKAHRALLIEHTKTSKHIKAAEPFSNQKQLKLQLDQSSASAYSLETVTVELKMILFVTCHCAIRSVDHLSSLIKPSFKTVHKFNEIKLHRTKAVAILKNIIAPNFKLDLRTDIGDSFYSLLIDESTNIAKMRGLGTDNASVMTGVNNVFRKLKEEVPHLILIRCVRHSIQLAVSQAMANTFPRNLEFLVSETFNWFSRSSERREQYKLLFKALNDDLDPLQILQVASTRWLSIASAVSRILQQWLELKTHFQLKRTADKCYTAELLYSYNIYSDSRNELYFIFLKPVLDETQNVNKAFQTNNGDVKLLNDLTILIQQLAQRIVISGCKENLLKVNIKHYLYPHPYLGCISYSFEEKMKHYRTNNLLTVEDEMKIRARCTDFITALINQLQQRLPDNIEIFSNVSLLSPEKCLRVVKPSVIPLAELMIESQDVITKIDFQWSKLLHVQWQNIKNTIPFWAEVKEYRDALGENPFEELVNLALKCLVLPWSNADVERTFSQMKNVKTFSRNRLNQDTINAILTTRAGLQRIEKCCHNYEFSSSVLRQVETMSAYKDQKESFNVSQIVSQCPFKENIALDDILFME